ncbi:ornithine decarboxylase antizyme-domain-containing protein [Crassisporium funariophilum]|nr:ornithine decarboxylase antizyme-domain-containing protein [Crassisporium funariophilum]
MSNISNQKSSLCPTNGRQTVGDGAFTFDNEPSVLAVCHLQGTDDMYYYSTTFSGGPGVSGELRIFIVLPKCPPDRGSSDCVTGSLASSIFSTFSDSTSSSPSSSPLSSYSNKHPFEHPYASPVKPDSYSQNYFPSASPRNIPVRSRSTLSTPPLTPDDGSNYSKGSQDSIIEPALQKDALDFLMTVFPHKGLLALPHAKSVSISGPNLGADFNGVVLELPGTMKTLYVDGKSAESVRLRESIVALLDLADESLECSALVIVLERSSPNLGGLLHSLMYVGGTVVTKPPFQVDPAFVLVGLEV